MFRTKSLEMHHKFYGEQNLNLAPEIEGMLQFAGLKKFIEESKIVLDKSNPILSQAFLLFIYYKKQILNLHTESLNNLAASQLLKKFGVAGIGIDQKTGKADAEITKSIIKTHDNLAADVTESSTEFENSLARFTIFFATIQTAIMKLITKYQENELTKLEAEKTEEKRVEVHLNEQSTRKHKVIYDSVIASTQAQKNRDKQRKDKQRNILANLKRLTSIAKEMFSPTELGTQEMKNMVLTT